jgi:hypothetical protein
MMNKTYEILNKKFTYLFVLLLACCANSAGDRNSLKTAKNDTQLKNVYNLEAQFSGIPS